MKWHCLVLGILLPGIFNVSHARVTSSFDGDLDGWTLAGNGTINHQSTGGNPAGFVQYHDQSGLGEDGHAVAPAKFLGSWQSLTNGGHLKWDQRILVQGDGETLLKARAQIKGPGGSAFVETSLMNAQWTTYSVPIQQSSWSVTSGNWASLISQVTSLTIRVEALWGGTVLETSGLDNVELGLANEVALSIAPAVEIYFTSVSGALHRVQYATNMITDLWSDLGAPLIGTGAEMSVYDSLVRLGTNRFYRVLTE